MPVVPFWKAGQAVIVSPEDKAKPVLVFALATE